MEIQEIIKRIQQGTPASGWVVFPYNKLRSILMLLYKFFFASLFDIPAIFLFNALPRPLDQENQMILGFLIVFGVIGTLVLIHHVYTLFFLKSNMIALTENVVVKSIRGKIFSWPYSNITNLKLNVTHVKNTLPVYSVAFTDSTNNGRMIELARGKEFGAAQDIFTVLKTKV